MEMIDLVPNDSGDYTCHVCNIHGCISYTRTLKVKGKCEIRLMNFDCYKIARK